jgi:multidrug transporter EmrE-like cation transporter
MIRLVYGILLGVVAQALTFLQLQGQYKYEWVKTNFIWMSLLGIPISLLFMYSVRHMVAAYDGELWPSRLIGYGIGATVFIIMSRMWFNEPISVKTLICLLLSLSIIFIQLFWK